MKEKQEMVYHIFLQARRGSKRLTKILKKYPRTEFRQTIFVFNDK